MSPAKNQATANHFLTNKTDFMIENSRIIRVKKLSDDDSEDLKHTKPQERLAMMWQLTLDAWAFKGETLAKPRLQRHIVRVLRPTS